MKSSSMSKKLCVSAPDRTRRVLQPPFCPKRISVSNLSPTMQIWDFEMPNLLSSEYRYGYVRRLKGSSSGNYKFTDQLKRGYQNCYTKNLLFFFPSTGEFESCIHARRMTNPWRFTECKITMDHTKELKTYDKFEDFL